MDRQVGSDLLNFEQFGKFLTNSILYEIGMTRQENNKIIILNTACQQKGPLAGYENRKFPKPFQGLLGMLREPPSAQKFRPRPHRPARTADFKCYFWLF